jgi:dinuclear metal center YbgI/SA1388 family protein
MTTIRDICRFLHDVAPLSLAEEWDNVGLLLGDDAADAARVITCLTLTPDVADEAIAVGARLIVSHHPVLFKPVKKLNSITSEGRMLLKLMRHGIAVYSPHTAYDNSATGINQQLAELFDLTQIAPLRPQSAGEQFKLVTFVPEGQLDQVRRSLWSAGAGVIGHYRECSFNSRGVGTFFGSDETNPAVGESGRLEQIDEVRVEVVCPARCLDQAIAELREAHPYEEPAIDVYPLKSAPDGSGSGRLGRLPQPLSLGELNRRVAERLSQPHVQFVGDPSRRIETLGIACGAATEFLRDAHRAGCDAFLTGEARFHACLEARDLHVALILPGHFATERPAMESLAKRLSTEFSGLVATASERERDPVRSM